MNKEFGFSIVPGGRVKIAGGSVEPYYTCALPMLEQGVDGALETAERFAYLRENPPEQLVKAFFPDDFKSAVRRMRGAGLYRHLRMDQGPGGNFVSHSQGESGFPLQHRLVGEQGYVIPEQRLMRQLSNAHVENDLHSLIDQITQAFRQNDYGQTVQLVKQFQVLAQAQGIISPDQGVGSRSGFFFIRPAETDIPVTLPTEIYENVENKMVAIFNQVSTLIGYTREGIKSGNSLSKSVADAYEVYFMTGPIDFKQPAFLYAQPDCFIDNAGNVCIEKINFPDVGLFLSQLSDNENSAFSDVKHVNESLFAEVTQVLSENLSGKRVVIVTRPEVLSDDEDTLEYLEIQALKQMCVEIGVSVSVTDLSAYSGLTQDQQVLLLNVDSTSEDFAQFTERVVQNDIQCFPDPLLRVFEEHATTMSRTYVSPKHLESLLRLIKPKKIDSANAKQVHGKVLELLDKEQLSEDILYAGIPGVKTMLPVFRYSLHSFFQLYNEIEKARERGFEVQDLLLHSVPFSRDTAVFSDNEGKRLAAFRFMAVRSEI